MRQIGVLPPTTDPQVFGDHLLSLGITSRAVQSPEGWALWVHNEDQVPRALDELRAYQADPDEPRFRASAATAEQLRREAERLDREHRRNVRDLSGRWDGATNFNLRRRPLTIALIAICVAVFVVAGLNRDWYATVWDRLAFFSTQTLIQNRMGAATNGLDDVERGQAWRILTPIFLHVDLVHLFFNMYATLIEGTIIESRRGTARFAILVLVSGVVSNLGQLLFVVNFYDRLNWWGGISGVGYALFGYLWMKGRYEPEQGMILSASTVRIMLLWLLLGFTGAFPMANGAHLVGLLVGVLFGLARF